MPQKKDPTEPIRLHAGRYPEVDEGTSCTQSSFRVGKKAFLFIGEQGGRYKAMFKLKASLPEVTKLAAKAPDDYQVGSWVTVRFTAEKPLSKKRWQKWLDESYELSRSTAKPAKKKKSAKKSAKKKTAKKRAVKKKGAAKKNVARKKASRKRAAD